MWYLNDKNLKTKTLHKNKLNLATNIHLIMKFSIQPNFNCNVPANIDNVFLDKWSQITTDTK